jgi:hypothetical protein
MTVPYRKKLIEVGLLTTIPFQQTPKGARIDFRIYDYPDGLGNFFVGDGQGRLVGDSQPVNNPEEAREVLEKIWARAMSLQLEPSDAGPQSQTITEQFADVIGTVSALPEDMAAQHDHYVHGVSKI